MKVARTKAQLKHLKTKRKKAKDKKKRRALRHGTVAAAGKGDEVMRAVGDAGTDGVVASGTEMSARMKKSALTARKRELRERIAELKSKRGKIGKKNFGRGDERKELTTQIKKLEAERAALLGGAGGVGEDDGEDDYVADEDVDMA